MPLPDQTRLQETLTTAIEDFGVPGTTLLLWDGAGFAEASAGVCNIETKVPVTPDTLFQIGSITKLYTAALCLQLVEEGKLKLDASVRETLPDFALGDEDTAARVTLRHLLNHTSGLDGDFFKDAGRGEDRIAKYVGLLKDVRQVHPLGHMFSYCNAGFVMAGRMVEAASGMGWDKAIRTRLAKPLGTPSFSTLPEQAMRHQTAIGHLGVPGSLIVTPIAYLAQSNAPAGSMPMARARDVLAFARMMMNKGRAPDGTQILLPESVAAMHGFTTACPAGMNIDAIGLASFMWDWDGDGTYETFGHDGSTIGQAAWLRYHPESGAAFVLLTNGGNGKGMADKLMAEYFPVLGHVAPPPMPAADPTLDYAAEPLLGRYGKASGTIDISQKDGKLVAHHAPSAEFAALQGIYDVELHPAAPGLFVGVPPGYTRPVTYHFLEEDRFGRARYLHHGVRAHPRLDE